jgi:UDP-N-acetylmuramyl pentapeptide phosphotransferase/UDP-N-acetylglucosamine-1-phosphate transferase
MFPEFLVPGLTAFFLTAVVLQLLLARAHRFLPVDRPNERSLHARPIPRFGGLAILVGSALALALPGGVAPLWLWPIPVLAAISLLDDFLTLPAVPRFIVQIAVAAAFALMQSINPLWLLPVIVAMVWMTNLYNFMDGSDGLAGGMALSGFSAYALLALLAGDGELAVVSVVLCGAALAFLLRNLHPASVFMGDAGSIPLGFLAAAIGLIGIRRGIWDAWLPLLVFLVFIADATVTLLQRLRRGERVWQPHRTHYYQRLVRMGFGHAGTAKLYFAAMVGCAACAVLVQLNAPRFGPALLAAWALLFILMGRCVDRRWRAFEQTAAGGLQ